jgi:hypothetical protein
MAKPSESQKSNKVTYAISDPLEENQETDTDQETSDVEEPTTIEPRWISVEELAHYYATHKPIGRKNPVQPQIDFDDLYIDDSRVQVRDSESEADEIKQTTKRTKKRSGKSTADSRSKIQVKADSVVQPTTSKSTKTKGKSKREEEKSSEESEEEISDEYEEKSSAEDEVRLEQQAKGSDGEKYKSCDTCTWARVKCVPGRKTNDNGDNICVKCEQRGRDCHFSIKGQRPAKQP